jgi:two-component system phosphate regulon response regulator PhoB
MEIRSILVLEDSPEYQMFLKAALQFEYRVFLCSDVAGAQDILRRHSIHLAILDVNLENENGFEFCSSIKRQLSYAEIPILFLTSRSNSVDKITGFSLGAEDYVVKPVDGLELLARINVIFRRSKKQKALLANTEVGGVSIDWSSQKVFISENNRPKEIFFTATEFKILGYLLQNPNRVITRESLLDKVWGNASNVIDRTVDTHVHAIRKKLGPKSAYLKTIAGTGYLFEYTRTA